MQATPVVSLTSSALTAPWGTSVTFTAKLTGGGAPPSGMVAFRDVGLQLGIGTLNSSGIAEFSTNALDAGTYSITAAYGGDSNYLPATSSALAMVVNKAEPTITWSNPSAVSYGTALSAKQLNATASVPGTFVYSPVGGTVLGTGSQTLSVTFTPAGSTDYRTATATILVNPAMLTVTVNNYSRVFETANPTFHYTITGFVNGDPQSAVSGSPVLSTSATFLSAVGSYPITAGPGTLTASNYTFGLVAGTLSITQATAPISVSANPTAPTSTTVSLGANVTLTATVSPASGSAPAPTGTVTFFDGATVLGAASVSASGVASFITNSLAAGSNTITAVYGGDKNYRASTSSATLTISDFQLRAMPESVVLTPTQQATVQVTVTPESNYTNRRYRERGDSNHFRSSNGGPGSTPLGSPIAHLRFASNFLLPRISRFDFCLSPWQDQPLDQQASDGRRGELTADICVQLRRCAIRFCARSHHLCDRHGHIRHVVAYRHSQVDG
jgi:hypothetical protein